MSGAARDCDVLIIGGGPVGLFLACELGAYGIHCELYEQEPGTSVHPKANTHSARSLELYRRHGLSERFRQVGWPQERSTDIVYCTRLTGHELGRVEMPSPQESLAAAEAGNARWPTAEPQLRASQLKLEPMLKDRAMSFPNIQLTFSTQVVSYAAGEGQVEVRIRDAQGERTRRARYLIACDGARSKTRGWLGVPFLGEGGLDLDFMGGMMVTTYFRAPTLLSLIPGRPAWQYWFLNPERRGLVVSLDGVDHFVLHHQLKAGQTLESFDFTAALTAAVGRPVPHTFISSAPWRAGKALVAEHYGRGRIALAGDAAHLFTPTGGLGVNTGIEDVANLSWKLAAAINGWAGRGLLASYERERRPIAERNTRFALSLAQAVSACPVHPEMETDSTAGIAARQSAKRHIERVARNEFDHPGLQLGSRYEGAGIVFGDDRATEGAQPQVTYEPTMIPGGRLPHVWIAPGKSLLDLCGHCFTFLNFSETGANADALASEAQQRGIGWTAHPLSRSEWVTGLGVSEVLVRPDQVVAWTGDGSELSREAIRKLLDLVTGHFAPGHGDFDWDVERN